MSILDCASSTVGSSCSDAKHDSQLDVRMMRTLNDVKFKNRPKYMVFSKFYYVCHVFYYSLIMYKDVRLKG